MRAARWDTTWESGGLWRVSFRWRLGAGSDAPSAQIGESRMELWPASGGPPAEPVITVPGELSDDERLLLLARTSEETAAAAPGRYRHRVLVHDPDIDDVRVLLRGFVTVAPPEASP